MAYNWKDHRTQVIEKLKNGRDAITSREAMNAFMNAPEEARKHWGLSLDTLTEMIDKEKRKRDKVSADIAKYQVERVRLLDLVMKTKRKYVEEYYGEVDDGKLLGLTERALGLAAYARENGVENLRGDEEILAYGFADLVPKDDSKFPDYKLELTEEAKILGTLWSEIREKITNSRMEFSSFNGYDVTETLKYD